MRTHWQALAGVVALAAACGGKAVIDPDSSGGSDPGTGGGQPGVGGMPGTGGMPGVGGVGLSAAGGSAPACGTPPPIGNVAGCSGAVTAGSGMFECASFTCDEGGNTWTTSCNDDGCSCLFNDAVVCNCGGGSPTCSDACCPSPFP